MKNEAMNCTPSQRRHHRSHRQYYSHVPRANVYRDGEQTIIELAVPGIEKKDLSIQMEGRHLVIRHDENGQAENRKTLSKGFDYNGFTRRFHLSRHIKVEAISARMDNGILSITLPLADEAKPRMIEIENS